MSWRHRTTTSTRANTSRTTRLASPGRRIAWSAPPVCEFHPAFDADSVEAVFTKGAVFGGLQRLRGRRRTAGTLADWLRVRGVDAVDVVGIATDYCVRATAADAAAAGFATRVLLDLTAGVARSPPPRPSTLCAPRASRSPVRWSAATDPDK